MIREINANRETIKTVIAFANALMPLLLLLAVGCWTRAEGSGV